MAYNGDTGGEALRVIHMIATVLERTDTMGIFEDLMAGAKNVVDYAGKKTDDVVELSKLKYQSSQLSNELRSLYEKLGCAVYSMMKSEYDNNELIDSLASEIEEVKNALQEVSEKIAEKKEQKLCPACGAKNDKEAFYCMKCGNRLVSVQQDDAPVAEEAPPEESCSEQEDCSEE